MRSMSLIRIGSIALVCVCLLVSNFGCGRRVQVIETDAEPMSLALDAWGRHLYVACEGSGKIQVWDVHKRKKIGEAEVENGPLRLYLGRDNATLHVLCQTAKVMLTFSVPDMKLKDTFSLPDGPNAVLVRDPQNQFTFCSPETNLLLTYVGKNPLPVIEIGLNPADIAAQPDSNVLWVANFKANEVAAVNVEKGLVVKRVPVWSSPLRVVPDLINSKLYVLCRGKEAPALASKIHLVDTAYQAAGLTWKAGTDARDLVMGPTGNLLYLVDQTSLRVLSLRTGEEVYSALTGKNPQALVVSPDGTHVYVACQDEDLVRVHVLKKEELAEK